MFARFTPSKYVETLRKIPVPGYAPGGGYVGITRYVSANPRFAGNARARALLGALLRLETDPAARQRLQLPGALEVFSGQGMPANIAWVFGRVIHHRQALCAVPELSVPLAAPNFLQAMCDQAVIGMDCIGFVGTYLASSGVHRYYGGNTPETFLHEFRPVASLDEVHELCVIVTCGFSHVQIIERVAHRGRNRLLVDICQSTAGGPQVNRGVTLVLGSGDYVAVDRVAQLRAEHRDPTPGQEGDRLWQDYCASIATPTERGFTAWLRPRMLLRGQSQGTIHGRTGAIFRLGTNGTQPNPVGGAVFVGAKRDLMGVA